MTKAESIVVSLAVGILCPLLLFVLCWWVTAALASHLSIPESWIRVAALTALAVGIGLDVLYLKKWIPHFYGLDMKLLVPVYLFCSAIAAAFCMGLPLGNVIVGTLAGAYVGRRAYHVAQSKKSFSKTAKRVGLFTALVTGAWALLIGLLTLDDEMAIDLLQTVVGLERVMIAGPVGVGVVIPLCLVLMVVQYLCAWTGAWMMFRLGEARGAYDACRYTRTRRRK